MISMNCVLRLENGLWKQRKNDIPTSPGLTKPALALRQVIEAAVLITLGASTMMIGDPTWSFDFVGDSFAQHLTVTLGVMDPPYYTPDCILENLVKEAKDKAM